MKQKAQTNSGPDWMGNFWCLVFLVVEIGLIVYYVMQGSN
jgi:hypothetical protein